MDQETAGKMFVFGFVGVSLAILCWRVGTPAQIPYAASFIEPEDVPNHGPNIYHVPPETIVGASYTLDDGAGEGMPWYTANMPWKRPAMPPRPSAVK